MEKFYVHNDAKCLMDRPTLFWGRGWVQGVMIVNAERVVIPYYFLQVSQGLLLAIVDSYASDAALLTAGFRSS